MQDALWSLVLQSLGLLLTGICVPWAISIYQRHAALQTADQQQRTAIELTDQQRAAVYRAVDTGAGILQLMLHRGSLQMAHIAPDSDQVVNAAAAAINRVPESATAQHVTLAAMAEMIAARVKPGLVAMAQAATSADLASGPLPVGRPVPTSTLTTAISIGP